MEHYDPDMVYVFRGKGDHLISEIENEIYESSNVRCDYFREVECDTKDYVSILANLVDIMKNLKKEYGDFLDVFVNISSGTHEFAAAAAFVSMTQNNMTAFNVDVVDYGIDGEGIREIISKFSPEVELPERILMTDNDVPGDEIIAFIKVLTVLLKENRCPSHQSIIKELENCGFWIYNKDKKINNGRTPLKQRKEMYLKRHYFKTAADRGFIKTSDKKIWVTDKGMTMLMVYEEKKMIEEEKYKVRASKNKMMLKANRIDYDDYSDHMSYNCIDIDDVIPPRSGKDVCFEHNGKTYRFRVDME